MCVAMALRIHVVARAVSAVGGYLPGGESYCVTLRLRITHQSGLCV